MTSKAAETGAQRPLERIAIVGDGYEAWMAAAALAHLLRGAEVKVSVSPGPADCVPSPLALVATPSVCRFHTQMGVDERDLVRYCRATFWTGVAYRDWAKPGDDYVRPLGAFGAPIDGVAFPQLWLRSKIAGSAAPIDCFSLASLVGRDGRFAHPAQAPDDVRSTYNYGLALNTERYAAYMRGYALHHGVEAIEAPLVSVDVDPSGAAANLTRADGARMGADLFIDCTGRGAALMTRIDPDGWRPSADEPSVIAWGATSALPRASLLHLQRATSNGWIADVRLQGEGFRLVAAPRASLDEASARAFGNGPPTWSENPEYGRRRPWVSNVIAIGAAACIMPPLEWPDLAIAEAGLSRLRELLPATSDAKRERDEYNRRMDAFSGRFADFQAFQIASLAGRARAFRDESSPLARKVRQFQSRGRIVLFDDESFDADSWLAAFLGSGLVPERTDPLADALPSAELEARLAAMQRAIRQAADKTPDQMEYLRRAGALSGARQ